MLFYDSRKPDYFPGSSLIIFERDLEFNLSILYGKAFDKLTISHCKSFDKKFTSDLNIKNIEIYKKIDVIESHAFDNVQNLMGIRFFVISNMIIESEAINVPTLNYLDFYEPYSRILYHLRFSPNSIIANSLNYIRLSNSIDLDFENLFSNCPNIEKIHFSHSNEILLFTNSNIFMPYSLFKKYNRTITGFSLINSSFYLKEMELYDQKFYIFRINGIEIPLYVRDFFWYGIISFIFPKEYKGCFSVIRYGTMRYWFYDASNFEDALIPSFEKLDIYVDKIQSKEMISPLKFENNNIPAKINDFEFKESVSRIGSQAFQNIASINQLIFSGDGPLIIESNATINTTINSISFSSSNLTLGKYLFVNKEIKKISLPNTISYIDEQTFINCSIEDFTINNETSINLTTFFINNPNTQRVHGWYRNHYIYEEGKKVLSNKIVFANRNSLEHGFPLSDIDIEDLIFENIVHPENILPPNCFNSKHSIKEITFNTHLVQISSSAFDGLKNIEKITFNNCFGEKSDLSYMTINNDAFINVETLSELYVNDNYLGVLENGIRCSPLKMIHIPASCSINFDNLLGNCPNINKF